MNTSQKGQIELLGHEGICLRPYLDSVGVWTLGGGSTASEGINIKAMDKTKYVSMAYVLDLFKNGLKKYENAINKALKVEVTQEQFDALVSVCYNIGCGGAANSTFMRRINNNDSSINIGKAIMMWNKPKEIIGRRTKEAMLYVTGVYSNKGQALLFDTNGAGKVNYSKGRTVSVEELLNEGA